MLFAVENDSKKVLVESLIQCKQLSLAHQFPLNCFLLSFSVMAEKLRALFKGFKFFSQLNGECKLMLGVNSCGVNRLLREPIWVPFARSDIFSRAWPQMNCLNNRVNTRLAKG